MLPVNSSGHSAYQDFVLENLRKYYPNPDSIARSTWGIIVGTFYDFLDRLWDSDDNLHPLKIKIKKLKTKGI